MAQDIPGPRHKTPNPHWTVSSRSNENHLPLGRTGRTAAPGLILALAGSVKHDFPLSGCLNNTGI